MISMCTEKLLKY